MSSTENTADGTQHTQVSEVPETAPRSEEFEAAGPGEQEVVSAAAPGAPAGSGEPTAESAPGSAAVTQDAGTPAAPAPQDAALADPTQASDATTAGDAADAAALPAPVDPPTADAQTADSPTADAPMSDAPVTEATASDAPVSHAPDSDAPVSDAPVSDAPVSDDESPAAEIPAAEAAADPAAVADPVVAGDGTPATDPADAAAPEQPADGAAPGRPGGRAVPRNRGRRGGGGNRPAAETPVVVPTAPPSDPTEWGRVDDDGTVYVRTADGERAVGSWQAGEPAEGLAHYGRRFDDIATEVLLLEARLAAHQGNPNELKIKAQALVDAIPTATAVGDLLSLALRAQTIVTIADAAIAVGKVEKAEARAAAIARKEALAVEAEAIGADSTQWKASGDRLKAIVEEWKTIKGIDRKTDEALWTRFAAARDAFGRRRGTHFAALDVARGESRGAKKELIAEAERLSTSTEWGSTSAAMRALMDRWKAVPRTGRDTDDDLWKQFRAAQDVFFAARTAQDKARDSEHTANQAAKEALLSEAEALDPAQKSAQTALRKIQERYDAVGHVPREAMRSLEDRMQAVEEKMRGATESARPRVVVENPMLTQMRAAVTKAEDQVRKAEAAGDARRVEEAQANLTTRREWLAEAERAASSGSRR